MSLLSLVAGFIDFIVEPTFSVLIDTTEKVIGPLIEEDRKAKETGNRKSRYQHNCYCSTLMQKASSHTCNGHLEGGFL